MEFEEEDENDTSVLSLGLFPGEYIEYAGRYRYGVRSDGTGRGSCGTVTGESR